MGQFNEKGSNGLCFVIVGGTGSGKSYFIKNTLLPSMNKFPLYIFDINKEYIKFKNRYKFVGHSDFIEKVKNLQNCIIVFEEATAFFSNKGMGLETIELMVRKRHQNNNVIFVFHSLRSIPVQIFDFVNYLTLLDTNDREDIVKNKYKNNPEIWEAFKSLQSVNQRFKKKIIKLY